MIFDKITFPSISSQNTAPHSSDLRSIFPYITRESRKSITTPLTESTFDQAEQPTVTKEKQQSPLEHPENKPSSIHVIGHRHPTLISSKIDPENILLFHKIPRTTLTQNRVDKVPKFYSEALSGQDKKKLAVAIPKQLRNM
ncbi:hypothetical protein O181_025151 [Austropuccinia psidii MF-1]|uniref:Uncharacterized protein n=1 Tax=Austropuccinia psidii MF-1 TaxID=1389203 RepID=A0A9Q3CMV1_9BASI|nr:hypothetical protein [Austropuccinia psidii MF-1]